MRTFFLRLIAVIAILALVLGAVAAYLDLPLYLLPIPDDLDAAVVKQLEAAKLPGAAIAVIKEDKIVFAKGYGYANVEEKRPVTPDTVFQIASVSKLVTGTALMRLHEQGRFDLDADINDYLPFDVRSPRYPDTPITVRMLLAHTSGIKDGPSYDASYTVGVSEDPTVALGDYLREYFTPGGAYYDAANNFYEHEPGSTYEYTNMGFGLVGYLVEQISGQPFDAFCEAEIFAPLGMTSTTWMYREVDKNNWAVPYGYDLIGRVYTPYGAYSFPTYPDGGLKTSASDFARFLSPFMNNGKTLDGQTFLQPETVAEMLRVQYPESGAENGLVWDLKVEKHQAQHTGMDLGIATMAVVNPQKHIGLIIFTNGGGERDLRSTFGFLQFVKNIAPRVLKLAQ